MAENTVTDLFHWADYLVFACSLVLVTAIGVYQGCFAGRKQKKSSTEFLSGGRSMSPFPVALSLLASVLSAPFILGTPVEIYLFGTMYSYILVGYMIGFPISAILFVPFFHKLNITSAYEYLEKRFNKTVRSIASLIFGLMMMLYMGVVVYAPALAMSQVTGVSDLLTIFAVGGVCTLYTALGGMKAIIWADVVQMFIILGSLLLLIIKGTIDAGGIERIWAKAEEGRRLDFVNFDPNPFNRHTFWTQVLGGAGQIIAFVGGNQSIIQRYLSVKTTKQAQVAVYISWVATSLYLGCVLVLGLVLYGYYYTCDPLSSGKVASGDQLVPYFVMEILGAYPGLPGLFSAALSAATISTVSGGVNALAAVTLVDIVKPLHHHLRKKDMTETVSTIVTRSIAVFFGIATIGLAFLAPLLGDTLLNVALSIFGMGGGPLLGTFCLGIFFPWANSWGAGVSMIASLAITLWIASGKILYEPAPVRLPLRTDGCFVTNVTTASYATTPMYETTTMMDNENFKFEDIYSWSYMLYVLLAVFVSLTVGLLVSWATGFQRGKQINKDLIHPYPTSCQCCFKPSTSCCWKNQHQFAEEDKGEILTYQTTEKVAPFMETQANGKTNGHVLPTEFKTTQNGHYHNSAFDGTPEIISYKLSTDL